MVSQGLPALEKTLVELILSDQFVDLTDIPPAKGRSPAASKLLEGQILLVQPADFLQTKRLIPDFPTWLHFYTAVLLSKFPVRAPSLLLYKKNVAYLSQRFRWPSWVVYVNQEAADLARYDWSQIDYGLQTIALEAWCMGCHAVDHLLASCPYTKPQEATNKRVLPTPQPPPTRNESPLPSAVTTTKGTGHAERILAADMDMSAYSVWAPTLRRSASRPTNLVGGRPRTQTGSYLSHFYS